MKGGLKHLDNNICRICNAIHRIRDGLYSEEKNEFNQIRSKSQGQKRENSA